MSYSAESISRSSASPAVGSFANYLGQITRIASENSAFNAAQAAENRNWQQQQNAIAMQFNTAEASKNRNWQEYMSSTAHQREVADLKAAGLNPVLSASGGNGASVTSGATAQGVTSSGSMGQADTSANAALVGLLGSMLQAQTAIANTATNAIANLSVADKYAEATRYAADVGYAGTAYSADVYASASRYTSDNSVLSSSIASFATQYASDNSRAASKYASDNSRAASKYSSDQSFFASTFASILSFNASKYNIDTRTATDKELAEFNASVNRELKKMDIDAKFDLAEQQAFFDIMQSRYRGGMFGTGLSAGNLTDAITDVLGGSTGFSAKSIIGSWSRK